MKSRNNNLVIGLDIGSTAVRIAVGTRANNGNLDILHLIGAAEVPSGGVHKGVVMSIEDAVSAVSACLERAERMCGAPIEHAWVGISGTHVLAQESKGVVAVSKADEEIANEDVERAVEAAKTVATPMNYEILHVIPKRFSVDGQTGIKDPIGMTGVRLEVDAQIIQGVSSQIKNLTKAVYRTGLDIDDLVLGVLACSEAVVTSRQKDLGVAVVNIGGATTSVAVFEEGDVLHTAILQIGSDHITSDLAIGLRTAIDVAERMKLEYGTASPKMVPKKEEIELASLGASDAELVDRRFVAQIIEARAEEIMEKIDRELQTVGKSGMLPAGIVFTGGGAKLPGLTEVAKRILRLPASLGYPLDITSVTDKVNDLAFTTAIGLVRWGVEMNGEEASGFGSLAAKFKGLNKVSVQVRTWFKALMP